MSERPQFTNESPVRREDGCVDAGEAAVEHGDQQRTRAIGTTAAKGAETEPMTAATIPTTITSRFEAWRERRREERRIAREKEFRNIIGPIADHVSFGLRGTPAGTLINVPSVYPATPTQVAYERRMRRQLRDPEGQKQLDDLLEFLTQKDEEERRSWEHNQDW
jgi:hypothetical protein